ncbi:MAG: MotA/TolQ/ExbB proton channel family protein [Methylocystis sp.]|uniref:MotA/TolQ/ExbB proton channel family protein n=1 Tax=Methylocystis sp. TaxID=1911079 RepID=UPI003DA47DA2
MDIPSMSPLGLFLNAGPTSKLVMAILLAASVWTWVLIIDAVIVARRIATSVKSAREGGPVGVLWPIVEAARDAQSLHLPYEMPKARRRRIEQHVNQAMQEFMIDARGDLPNLAIVSSVCPFVGLFGTVWGIMSSFAGIAATQETSLAVVAPGIAEALAATSYGLAAAIPAAIGYNRFGAAISRLNDEIRDVMKAALPAG